MEHFFPKDFFKITLPLLIPLVLIVIGSVLYSNFKKAQTEVIKSGSSFSCTVDGEWVHFEHPLLLFSFQYPPCFTFRQVPSSTVPFHEFVLKALDKYVGGQSFPRFEVYLGRFNSPYVDNRVPPSQVLKRDLVDEFPVEYRLYTPGESRVFTAEIEKDTLLPGFISDRFVISFRSAASDSTDYLPFVERIAQSLKFYR